MILILKEGHGPDSDAVTQVREVVSRFEGVEVRVHTIVGAQRSVTEVYLLGNTAQVPSRHFENLPFVERAFRVSETYRQIGRHEGNAAPLGFEYQGISFGENSFQIFLGQ
jgi:3-deoxy-7-phosphoheptulonate synthase